jgi:HlyD family secretion protein
MLGKRSFIIFIAVLIIASFAGCSKSNENIITASGTIEATEVNVSAEVSGKITECYVDEGTAVKNKSSLAKLDSTIPAFQVLQAEAVLKAAQEKSKETKKGSRKELIEQAQSSVNQIASLQSGAKQSMDNARDNLKRIQELTVEGGATTQQLADAQTKYEIAKTQYDAYASQKRSAQEQLDLLKNGATTETISIADAGVAQARASLDIAKAQLLKCMINSPIDGTISEVNYKTGEFVSTGAPIFTLINIQDSWIAVFISEKDIPKIKLGQSAVISVDAYPDKKFKGQVSFISDKAEFTPKNLQTKEERVNAVFAVKVKLLEGKEQLKPGLPADVEITSQ